MINKTFEANFSTTGTPVIRIYENNSGTYALVQTDNMTATPETGKYVYEFIGLDQMKDYSARMELGSEKLDAVYNGIFSQILAKPSGGGITRDHKLTRDQLEEIVKEMTKLMEKSLDGMQIDLMEDLGKKEVAEAVSIIKESGISKMQEIEKAALKQIKSLNRDNEAFDKVVKSIENLAESKSRENKEIISKIEGLARNNKTPLIAKALKVIKTEQEKESKRLDGDILKVAKSVLSLKQKRSEEELKKAEEVIAKFKPNKQ